MRKKYACIRPWIDPGLVTALLICASTLAQASPPPPPAPGARCWCCCCGAPPGPRMAPMRSRNFPGQPMLPPDHPMNGRPGQFGESSARPRAQFPLAAPADELAQMRRVMSRLDLNPDQREAIRDTVQGTLSRGRRLAEQMRGARRKIIAMASEDEINEEAIRDQAARIGRMEAEAGLLRAKTLSRIREHLSPEQWERFREEGRALATRFEGPESAWGQPLAAGEESNWNPPRRNRPEQPPRNLPRAPMRRNWDPPARDAEAPATEEEP